MDYILLIDEAGQPYIAHGLWSSAKSVAKKAGSAVKSTATSAGRSAHKYLMKVGEGAKARYFYTKAEIDALLANTYTKAEVDAAIAAAIEAAFAGIATVEGGSF